MAVSKLLAQQLAKLALDEEQSVESKNPEEDFKDFSNTSKSIGDFKSLLSNSADLQSPKEDSGGNKRAEEEPMDNENSMDEASKTPKSGTPAELVSLAVLKRLKGTFTGATLDCQLPCTAAEDKLCQIFNHLSAWNEFLWLASLQLQETTGTSGNLALVCQAGPDLAARPSEKQWHQIYTLVYWLLKIHHCIVRVQIDVPHFKRIAHLLCDALQENPNVRSLRLWFGGYGTREDQVPDILSMTNLRELRCAGYLEGTETLLCQLSSLLRTSRSLTTLRISDMTLQGPSVKDFFTALGENRLLEELALPESIIGEATPAAQALFARFLKNSTSLKTLSFVAAFEKYFCLQWILEGLVGNKSVVSVSFKGLLVDRAAIQVMAEVFAKNEVLQSFTVSYGSDGETLGLDSSVRGQPTESDFDRLHKSLVRNDTLEQVSLPIEFWDSKQWKALFEALTMKDSPNMLTIEVPKRLTFIKRDGSCHLLDVSAALEGAGAEDKVSLKVSLFHIWTDSFSSRASSEAFVYASDHNTPTACEFLECLPSLGHIKSLELELGYVDGNDEFSATFTTFLRETRTLKTLRIGINEDLWRLEEAIVKGVAINTSLREVCIRVDRVLSDLSEFSKPLTEAINSSKTISRVKINVAENQDAVHSFVQNLSLGITNNYTLLSVSVIMFEPLGKEAEVYWFQVDDVLRRNRGLVTAAADFARGVRRDRHCALALEQVYHHPELVEEVARLESVDEARAASMVQEGFQTMANMADFV
ncbi:uncharacterized protein LOC144139190 [Haemaphysalis longicornis]